MPNPDFKEVVFARRSVRKFTDQTPDIDLIKKILELAIQAPSACNIQGWHFIIVDDENLKRKIVDAGSSAAILGGLGILVLYDNRTTNYEYRDDIQSAAAAIQNLLLAATSYGLAGSWLCHIPTKKQLRKILNIPAYFDPMAYVILGYPQRAPFPMPRKYKLDEIISRNKFEREGAKEKTSMIALKKILIKIYYLIPLFLRKGFVNKIVDKYFVKKFNN